MKPTDTNSLQPANQEPVGGGEARKKYVAPRLRPLGRVAAVTGSAPRAPRPQ